MTLRNHGKEMLNYFHARLTNALCCLNQRDDSSNKAQGKRFSYL
ncbi:MAG: hypothetical protein HXO83_00700 [Selenomonas sp.]|nr:hypothetical protein [Selenomonas sp.]